MPILTNRERLTPGPTPNVPPWADLSTRDMSDWLHRSLQVLYLWEVRRHGPPRRVLKNKRTVYRLADVLHWIEGEQSPTGAERVRAYLREHQRDLGFATMDWRAEEVAAKVRRGLARIDELTPNEVDDIGAIFNKFGVSGVSCSSKQEDEHYV